MDYECSMDDDSNFEPIQRTRSNTWPMMQPTNSDDTNPDNLNAIKTTKLDRNPPSNAFVRGVTRTSSMKRKSQRRTNAWGNLTYAELITQAISSSENQRLTLSQIYDWMITNVDHFKEKRDSSSSSGWKNSIRHNLSLHNRFFRVANDSAGKSSYWMVNPDISQNSKSRRRATMDPEKLEKIRGRAKRQASLVRTSASDRIRNPDVVVVGSTSESETINRANGFSVNRSVAHVAQSSTIFRPQVVNCSPSGGTLSAFPTLSYTMQDQQTSMKNFDAFRDQSSNWMQVNPISLDFTGHRSLQNFEHQSVTSYGENNFEDTRVCSGPTVIRSCIYHKNENCNCNSTILEIVDSGPSLELSKSHVSYESGRQYDVSSKHSVSRGKVMSSGYMLKPIQETIVTSSVVSNEVVVDSVASSRSLTKSSSMLDDISEVIGKELVTETVDVNQVENSLSSTLHISQNILYDNDKESWA
ncbi:hypothetical protein QAD02_019523 [Eretmocerus hayati]|uniref:Uncharacterized protein n=1 Tax=Eretmocerus hayati TaxID=131215 RepID=A0ACC2PL22_9HYME|nr:hypothetical protein QAD02_019523 [Eretmocerus hayati]